DGLVTKAEVRAVALGKLALPAGGVIWDVGAGSGSVPIEIARVAPRGRGVGVIWDVGAGSGSVAIEIAAIAPRARVIAIERVEEDVRRIEANARAHGVTIELIHGEAPGVLDQLPDPDRVFV